MVFVKSFLDGLLVAFAVVFGSLLLFGFSVPSFFASTVFSPVGFLAIALMAFLELAGIRW